MRDSQPSSSSSSICHLIYIPSHTPSAVLQSYCSKLPFSLAVSVILQTPPPPPLPNLLQGLSAGQQGLLQLADAALQLVNLFVALSQLTTQLL